MFFNTYPNGLDFTGVQNWEMQSDVTLELDPKRLRHIPGQNLRKHEMNHICFHSYLKSFQKQQKQRSVPNSMNSPFLKISKGE